MKILVVLYKFGTPEEIGKNLGSYDYFYNQLLELSKKNIEIIVLAPWLKWNKKGSKKIDSIKIIRYWPKLAAKSFRNFLLYKLINKLYIYITKIKTEKVIKREKINIVYVRQARETGFSVSKIKKNFPNIPIVFQPITTWCWHFKEAGDNLLKKIVKDIKKISPEIHLCTHIMYNFPTESKEDFKESLKLAREFDYFIAQADMMPQIAQVFGRYFGPINRMPSPRAGAIVPPKANLEPIVTKLRDTVRLIANKAPVFQCSIGYEDQKDEELTSNILKVVDAVEHALPNGRNNMGKVYVKSTMSKKVNV